MTLAKDKVHKHCPTRYQVFCEQNEILDNLINEYDQIICEIYQVSDRSGTIGAKGGKISKNEKK